MDTLKSIATRFSIPYLDYSPDSLMYHKELFYNTTHLNKKGAEIFTRQLAADLKNLIK
jgi:lysophospholipase L1-like esterase